MWEREGEEGWEMFPPRSTTEATTLYNLILQGCGSARVLKKSSFICKTCCFLVGTGSFYFLGTREALSKLLLVYEAAVPVLRTPWSISPTDQEPTAVVEVVKVAKEREHMARCREECCTKSA